MSLDNVNADIYAEQSHVSSELVAKLGLNEDDMAAALEETNFQVLSVIQLFNPTAFTIY